MNYSINKFFEKDECYSIIKYADRMGKQFTYTNNNGWDCKRIGDVEFNKMIVDRFNKNYINNSFKMWFPLEEFEVKDVNISITKYYDGRWLDLHLDSTSQLTTVIVLSDNFLDGRFMLSESYNKNECKKYELGVGESISFDGSKLYHGVMPVTEGIRCALNIWMTNTNFKYLKLDEPKKLI